MSTVNSVGEPAHGREAHRDCRRSSWPHGRNGVRERDGMGQVAALDRLEPRQDAPGRWSSAEDRHVSHEHLVQASIAREAAQTVLGGLGLGEERVHRCLEDLGVKIDVSGHM
jgi:hypothetical protein